MTKKVEKDSSFTDINNNPFHYVDEKDVFGILLNQMQEKLITIREQEIIHINEKTAALIEGEEKERERIARELHDGIGQMLTALKLTINLIKDQDDLKVELKKILTETIIEVRRISSNLMPSVLYNYGLLPAIKALYESLKNITEIKLEIILPESDEIEAMDFQRKIAIYRIIQEALNNAIKYSEASLISVYIRTVNKNIELIISDNGKGFDVTTVKLSSGLSNMRSRAEIIAGSKFEIISTVEEGTTININMPIV